MTTPAGGAPAPEPDCLHEFHVTADLCPQALLRILGLVAQHSLIPRGLACERHDDALHVRIAVDGLSPERVDILLAKIAAIVTVREAEVRRGGSGSTTPHAPCGGPWLRSASAASRRGA